MDRTELSDLLYASIAHLPVACIISRARGAEIVAVNDAAVEMLGYDRREELLTLDVNDITAPEYRADLANNYVMTLSEGLTTVKGYLRRDGSVVPAQLIARPLVGHPELAIAVLVDLDLVDKLRSDEPPSP